MAVRFPSSVFLYHDPRTYWTPTKVEPSRKPTKKRIGYNYEYTISLFKFQSKREVLLGLPPPLLVFLCRT